MAKGNAWKQNGNGRKYSNEDRYEVLSRCLDLVLEMKRFHSMGGRGMAPMDGAEHIFFYYETSAEVLREMMREMV